MNETLTGTNPSPDQDPKRPAKEAGARQYPIYPWNDQPDFAACNFALGSFLHNLRTRLTFNGRLHAETYLTAGGVIAGFAAQRSLFERISAENDQATLQQLSVATLPTGKFFQGRPLNNMLIPGEHAPIGERLWSLAGNGAISAGLSIENLPKLVDLFNHVTKSLGGEDEGMPSVPKENYPGVHPKELLKLIWPFATMCFSGDAPEKVAPGKRLWPAHLGSASPKFWPAITGHVAASLIHEVKSVLEPAEALVIVMESAIYASILDPAAVITKQPAG